MTTSHAADPVDLRLAAAERIAISAGRRALRHFQARDQLTIERKSSVQDLVSEADREVEHEIRDAVAAAFPGDALLGEEHGAAEGASGYTWVIDPIDGTVPFLTGQPNWCVSIAVTGPEGIVAGVIHAPVLGETYTARRGGGAFLDGRRLVMDPEWTLTSANIAFGATNTAEPVETGRFVEALYREGGILFRIGSGALMLGYVASGRLAGYFDPAINSWDCYAGILIVEEAGGIVDFRGGPTRSGPLWAGNPRVVPELVRLAEEAAAGSGVPSRVF
jgi:myo-inositol-1(or 4)-monophosphatase